MHILIFGCNGQVGWELQRSLAPLGQVTALDFNSTFHCGDFSKPKLVKQTVMALRPDVIVNAAAHTAVDKAEYERDFAQLLNSDSVQAIAEAAESIGAWLVHYSTDYVFDGSGDQYRIETDLTGPLNVYGETKLAGERAVQAICSRYLIFRTSWVYAVRGANFAKTILKLGQSKVELSIINDQFGAPTGAELLADVTAQAIRIAQQKTEVAGLYHLVASGTTSWFDYANLVFDLARKAGVELTVRNVIPVLTSVFPTAAKRPHNSRLNNNKLQQSFDLVLPDWQVGVERMVTELLGK